MKDICTVAITVDRSATMKVICTMAITVDISVNRCSLHTRTLKQSIIENLSVGWNVGLDHSLNSSLLDWPSNMFRMVLHGGFVCSQQTERWFYTTMKSFKIWGSCRRPAHIGDRSVAASTVFLVIAFGLHHIWSETDPLPFSVASSTWRNKAWTFGGRSRLGLQQLVAPQNKKHHAPRHYYNR